MGSLGQSASKEELDKMIREVDADGDGFISLGEFIELNTKDIDPNEVLENLKDAFSVFDIDGNGSITADELHNVMASLGESKKLKLEKELEKIKQNYEDLEYASMKCLDDTVDNLKAQFQVLVLEFNISIIDPDKIMVGDQIVLIPEEPKLDNP
ncbi:hypothetical protein AHAS_Ahas15G0264600 [Arachis hypogaea]